MATIVTDPQHSVLLSSTQVDSTGTALTTQDASYGSPVYTSSNTAAVALVAGGRAIFGGTYGTSTITSTETSSDTTKPVLTGTVAITFQGPAAAALQVNTQVVVGN